MSGPKGNEPKGFLGGSDDLDLDAWDATFDALHGPGEAGGEAGEGLLGDVQPDVATDSGAAAEAAGAGGFTGDAADDFAEAEEYTSINDDGAPDDGPEYVAQALSQPYRRTPAGGYDLEGAPVRSSETQADGDFDEDPAEIEIGAEAGARGVTAGGDATGDQSMDQSLDAIGDDDGTRANLEVEAGEPDDDFEDDPDASDFGDASTVELGDAVMLAELDKFEKFEEAAKRSRRRFAAVVPRDATRTDAKRAAAPPADMVDADSDADVYTSAARPGTSSEAVAQPPRPAGLPLRPPVAARPPAGPAIPRTITPGQQVSRSVVRRRQPQDSTTGFEGDESTRIADFDVLAQGMSASREVSHPTPPVGIPVTADLDDDYADIEIEGSSSSPAAESARPPSEGETPSSSPALVLPPAPPAGAAPSVARRTAHVLRRRGPATKPPPGGEVSVVRTSSMPSLATPAAAAAPASRGGEDDFSDVMDADDAGASISVEEGRTERDLGDRDRTPAPAPLRPQPRPTPNLISAQPAGASGASGAKPGDASTSDLRAVAAVAPRPHVTPVPRTTVVSPPPAGMAPVTSLLHDEDGEEVTTMIGSETKADVAPAPPLSPFDELSEPDDDFEDDDEDSAEIEIRPASRSGRLPSAADVDPTRVGSRAAPVPAGRPATRPGSSSEDADATSVVIELRNKRTPVAGTPITPNPSAAPGTPGSGARPLPSSSSGAPGTPGSGARPLPSSSSSGAPGAPGSGARPLPSSSAPGTPGTPGSGARPLPSSSSGMPGTPGSGARPLPSSAPGTPGTPGSGARPLPSSSPGTPGSGARPLPSSSAPGTPGSGARPLPGSTPTAFPGAAPQPMVPSRVKTPTSVPAMGSRRELLASPRPAATGAVSFDELAAGSEPSINLDKISLPESLPPLAVSGLDESFAQTLELIEEDLQTIDDREGSAALRLEAGRLAERLGEAERARGHYDAAVLADPRLGAALRGLRRIAMASGDLSVATHQLDAELEVAGSLERRPLGHYRADLLMAAAEQDLARVAVGEMLDAAPSDVRALIAQLELAYLDGRYEELGASLGQLAHAVSDAGLRAAAETARAVLSTRPELTTPAIGQLFLTAAASDPSAMMARLSAARHLTLENEQSVAADAMTQVAFQIALADKDVAAALAVRSLLWGAPDGAVDLAATAAPADPIVAQTMVEAASPSDAAAALSRCADRAPSLARRSYLAGLAAEIDLEHASQHWAHVLAADPGDDYAAAQLRTSHVASDAQGAAIEVDLAASQEENRERSRLRGGFGLAGLGQMDRAIEVLREGRKARPNSLPIAEALAEVYAQGALWRERAELFSELATAGSETLDPELAAMRSALAWEDAATAASGDDANHARRQAVTAWQVVLEAAPSSPVALGALIALAKALEDQELLRSALARAATVERMPWMSSSLALRRARHVELEDESDSLLRDAQQLGIDDPRRLTMAAWLAARRGELDEIATAYDDRARALEEQDPPRTVEAASLRLRAAQLSVEANDPARAATLFAAVGEALPTLSVVPDLLASARRRAGDQPVAAAAVRRTSPQSTSGDEFARWIREGDYLAGQGDTAGALGLYQRALDLHPHDPLAAEPLRRLATSAGESAPIAALALGRLRNAEASGQPSQIADAYLVLADLDLNVRKDEGAAMIALESAIKADPTRLGALRQLGTLYASRNQLGDLLRIRRLQLEQVAAIPGDKAALLFDVASLAERDGRNDDEVSEALAAALEISPKQRLGLFQLEALVRRKGPSAQLAALEEQISQYFEGDGRSVAAFLTRAGETLAEVGDIEAAIARFKRAEESFPGHIPALRGWRLAALKGELWLDVAESASREAAATDDLAARAELYHLAGVALMDKAALAERAMVPLQRALVAVPAHRDAFLRLRILLEEDARHEDLATLLERRLDVETAADAKVELHRALADLHRNFLSDREVAKRHYRAILELRADDLRAYGALSDIAWELGEWADAAEALQARARLEREPSVLRNLYFRLGLIYADRLPDVPAALGWFQKALQYDPDDSDTLVRLADLAAGAGEWKLALTACDRLVKNETNPELRVAHLHRVARIFVDGLGDRKRAERALNLALDGAPTNSAARHELVRFYRAANDSTSIRIHLTRVAGVMRSRIEANPRDAEAYQVLSRAMVDRESAAAPGSLAVARIAAELALLTGGTGEDLGAERRLVAESHAPRVLALSAPDANDLLFPRTVQGELRQMFHLLGDRLAKHVGVDLRAYGTTRGERLRAKESPVARVSQDVASELGFGEIDVFVAPRLPWVTATEPTNPVSLILGKDLAAGSEARVRFAAASALKLASCSLSIAARLPAEELGVLVVALLRLFTPELPALNVDQAAVSAQVQKLRRLIPTNLINELRPYALSLDASRLDPVALSTDLRAAGLRAGVVATQSVLPALEIIAGGEDPAAALSNPMAADLLKFALGEDMVALSR